VLQADKRRGVRGIGKVKTGTISSPRLVAKIKDLVRTRELLLIHIRL